jgi:hypothetical protein
VILFGALAQKNHQLSWWKKNLKIQEKILLCYNKDKVCQPHPKSKGGFLS